MSYFTKPYIIGGAIMSALAAIYFWTLTPRSEQGASVAVARGDVVHEVFLTGVVKPARFAELSFDRAGTLASFPAVVGKTVAAGAILATLKNETERAAVAEARAARAVSEARLAEVVRGARPEELRIKEAAKMEKEIVLRNLAEKSAAQIADAYAAADDALNRYADPLFSNDDSAAPRLTFSTGNQSGVYEAEFKRIVAGTHLKEIRARVVDGSGAAETALTETLRNIRGILELFLVLDTVLTDGSGLSASALSDYKERTAVARGKIISALTATQSHINALREGESALRKAESELVLEKAGAAEEEIRQAQEELKKRDAALRAGESSLEKTLLRAPFEGRITSRRGNAGETIGAGDSVATLESGEGFIIEAEVPEADSAKINLGDAGKVTLDAYGEEALFAARVSEIEQSEKVIEGVSTYKTTLVFTYADSRLRSGLTANIALTTDERRGVFTLPARAIRSASRTDAVTIQNADGIRETRAVTLGLRGSNGLVEIIAGLSDGDRILLPAAE